MKRIRLDTIDSTNKWAKENAPGLPQDEITLITADFQTGGYGKYKRSWLSSRGKNLLFTLHIPKLKNPSIAGNLLQILSLATVQVLENFNLHLKIRWPNDILVNGKKIGGILAENGPYGFIIGMGLNVNEERENLEKVDQPATSLFDITNQSWEREPLLTQITEHFTLLFFRLEKEGFSPFQNEYDAKLYCKGEMVSYVDGEKKFHGKLLGVDQNGMLKMQVGDEILTLFGGEMVIK